MDRVGVGVVGCGFVGRGAHVPAFNAIENAQLAAIADPDDGRREKATKKYQIDSSYPDYQELVHDPAVQAVVVAVPTPLHVPVAMAAIEAGKHVLCEMPLAYRLDEADAMIDAAREKGVILMPGLTFRFTPNFVQAKAMIGQDSFGQPSAALYRESIPASDLAHQWPPGSWVWDLDASGGPLFTLSVWSIDLFRWLFDSEVTELSATTSYTRLPQFGGTLGYDAYATLRLENGLAGCLQYSGTVASSASGSMLEIVGSSTQVIHAEGNDKLTLYGHDPDKTQWNLKQPGAGAWGHLQQDQHFVDSIMRGSQPSISPEDGRKAMELALKIAAN